MPHKQFDLPLRDFPACLLNNWSEEMRRSGRGIRQFCVTRAEQLAGGVVCLGVSEARFGQCGFEVANFEVHVDCCPCVVAMHSTSWVGRISSSSWQCAFLPSSMLSGCPFPPPLEWWCLHVRGWCPTDECGYLLRRVDFPHLCSVAR